MKSICPSHRIGDKIYGRDDMTVQLKCLDCGKIISVDSADYDHEKTMDDIEEVK